jgi:hypothetical protein
MMVVSAIIFLFWAIFAVNGAEQKADVTAYIGDSPVVLQNALVFIRISFLYH